MPCPYISGNRFFINGLHHNSARQFDGKTYYFSHQKGKHRGPPGKGKAWATSKPCSRRTFQAKQKVCNSTQEVEHYRCMNPDYPPGLKQPCRSAALGTIGACNRAEGDTPTIINGADQPLRPETTA
jgi:hypothetical protein